MSQEANLQGALLNIEQRIMSLRDISYQHPSTDLDNQIAKLEGEKANLQKLLNLPQDKQRTVENVRQEHFHSEKPEMKQVDVIASVRGTKTQQDGQHYCWHVTFLRSDDSEQGRILSCHDDPEHVGDQKFCESSDRLLSMEEGKQTLMEAADFFRKIGYSVQTVGI
jgi:hypothetical protein